MLQLKELKRDGRLGAERALPPTFCKRLTLQGLEGGGRQKDREQRS